MSDQPLDHALKEQVILNRAFDDDTSKLNVQMTAVTPGTAASNLGKAEDAAHASGDVGVMALAVRQDNATTLTDTDGDYSPLTVSEHNCLNVDPQHYFTLDDCDSTDGWSVINNDTLNLTTSTNHVWKTKSLSFDKVNGAGNTIFAGIQRTVTSVSINKFMEEGGGFFLGSVYLSSIANVAYVWFRVGTDSSNYAEWRIADTDITAARWNALRGVMRAPYTSAGNGINTGAVTYMAIGVAFDAETDTLAEILVDGLFANSGLQTSSDITSQISSSVSSPNVRLVGYGGSVSVGSGVNGVGVLRTTIATDDTNVAAIKTAVETIDNFISGSKGLVTEDNSAAIKTAVEALDNSVDGNYLNVNMNLAGTDVSATTPLPVRPNEYELAGNTTHVKKYYTNSGAVTDGIIWSPAAGKRWYVTDIIINTSAAATVTLEDDLAAGDSAVMKFELAANGGMVCNFKTPLFSGEDAADLLITTSAGNIYVTVTGYEI